MAPLGADLAEPLAALQSSSFVAQFLETVSTVAQVAVLVGAGFILRRTNIIDQDSTRALSRVTVNMLLPCFLLTRLSTLDPAGLLRARGLSLGLFILIVAGFAIGAAASKAIDVPKRYARSFISSCAFGNGTALPIIMVSSIVTTSSSLREIYSEAEAIGVLAVALPVQHILMWLISYNFIKGTLFPEPEVGRREGVPLLLQEDTPAEELEADDDTLAPKAAETYVPIAEGQALSTASPMYFWRYTSLAYRHASAGLPDDLKAFLELLNPPLFGIMAGFALAFTPALHDVWAQPEGPLSWLAVSFERLGSAVVPISMMTLGSNLSEGPGDKMPLKPITTMFVVRQLVMPLFGVALSIAMRHAGIFPANDALPPLVLMVLASAPTANNIVTIATACNAGAVEISECVFWQYIGFLAVQLVYIPVFISVAEFW